ncbi:MAG: tetraacyldisaccharide 4'-kinase [Alphaproteobacteria bacterium]|nr:MAG: tetraacyldisaccharide 4'-kinase [Alphaproteobacteria bacterium]
MALQEAPSFWWRKPGLPAYLLSPLSLAWGAASAWRMEKAPTAVAGVPVICVGNFIAGGSGKTPAAMAIGRAALGAGLRPGFLSRGFGGHLVGPVRVDPQRHRAFEVGDEPLLLSAVATTVVAVNRAAGAARLVAEGCDFIIMDDGFQNPRLAKDFCLVVVDARRGIGNGYTIPAGPLRAPLSRQFALADAIAVVGQAPAGERLIRETARRAKPVHLARLVPSETRRWQGRRVLAYAGIADPDKFFASLAAAGAEIVARRPFGDHHVFTDEEIEDLLETAAAGELTLVTTAKDMARLRDDAMPAGRLAERSEVFAVDLEFEDPRAAGLIIDLTVQRWKENELRRRPGR